MTIRIILRSHQNYFYLLMIALAVLISFFIEPTVSFIAPKPILLRRPTNFAKEISVRFSSSSDSATGLLDDTVQQHQVTTIDRRPHEQRTKGPRPARRLNHGFRFLYRNSSHLHHNVTAFEYLTQFYTEKEVIEMNRTFPPLLDLDVPRHVHPKIRFLQETILTSSDNNDGDGQNKYNNIDNMNISQYEIPSQYFGARLEKTIAPRHAFLVYNNLPNGLSLLRREEELTSSNSTRYDNQRTTTRLQEFLLSCRKTKRFSALCNQWRKEEQEQEQQQEKQQTNSSHHIDNTSNVEQITSKQIEAFDFIFGRGLLAAARNELVQKDNNWPLEYINITSSDILKLLIQHGANPLERDTRGSTLLHWAAGVGNLEGFQTLLPYFPNELLEKTERDGATPLHWACAGANSKEFGTGGYYYLCQYIISECDRRNKDRSLQNRDTILSAKDLVNQRTKDGNSPLMWAAWSRSLDIVKLMVRYRAEWDTSNRNGCTVAHWGT